MSHTLHRGRGLGRFTCAITLLATLLTSLNCDKRNDSSGPSGSNNGTAQTPSEPTVDVSFVYGSEKKTWINDVTAAFNAADIKTSSGKRVVVHADPLGSGECIDDVLAGRRQADVISPASGAFITLGNAESKVKTGQDLVGTTDNLVLSPVVIAMWKPMAEALGWGKKPIGWQDILAVERDPSGWAKYGHPEWGRFKFGHTHPEYSNSGLISALAIVYAGAGKVSNLTLADVADPKVGAFMSEIESAVQHYGSSTGFFADALEDGGPQYLSAAVMYESLVCDSYKHDPPLATPLVAIYPREGTFWSDHPVGIVQRPWVTAEKKEAAKLYIDYLRAEPQQRKALQYGFRPGEPAIALGDPISPRFGVDPAEPRTTLAVPSADVSNAVLQLWRTHKKPANLVLVLDTSGSMDDEHKLTNAVAGATQLIHQLGDADSLSLLTFSDEMHWLGQGWKMADARQQALSTVSGLSAGGTTKLYDSVDAAVAYLRQNARPDAINAIVVLTDGEDNRSQLNVESLLRKIGPASESVFRVFTIGYGSDADERGLKRLAGATRAKYYKGTPQNIRDVFKDIATFF